MLKFFRTGQIVPEWLNKISAHGTDAIPVMTFGSPTIVISKGGVFHCWSAISFGRGSIFYIGGTWEQVYVEGQGNGVHFYGTFHLFLKAIFRHATAKWGTND